MLPNRFHIWVVSPPNFSHVRVFDEIVLALRCGFKELGYLVPVHRGITPLNGPALVVAGNLLSMIPPVKLQEGSIIYNLEQLYDGSMWLHKAYTNVLKNHKVWDYSFKNISKLASMGIHNVSHVLPGYVKELERFPDVEEEYDVAFIGSINGRRSLILNEIESRGLKVLRKFNYYGKDRDLALAKSKIILNIHALEAKVFEVVRVSYALANKKLVISENGYDHILERCFSDAIVWGQTDKIADLCVKYIKDDESRRVIAERGRNIIRSMPIKDYIASAMNLDAKAG